MTEHEQMVEDCEQRESRLTAKQVIDLYHQFGVGRLDGFAAAMRRAEEMLAGAAPTPVEPAIKRFNEIEADPENDLKGETPLERLRFFCSLAMKMNPQDWLDVEPFFDALAVEPGNPANQATEVQKFAANVRWFDAFTLDRCGCVFETSQIMDWIADLFAGREYTPGPGADPANQAEPVAWMTPGFPQLITDEWKRENIDVYPWVKDYVTPLYAHPAGAQGGEAPADDALKAFAEFVHKESPAGCPKAPVILWLARFKAANPDVHSTTTATKAPGAAGEGAGSGSGL